MKKKIFIFILLFNLFLLPNNVFAMSSKEAAEKMNEYMKDAIFGTKWKLEDGKQSDYDIAIKVGNTSDKTFKEVLDNIPYTSPLNHDSYKAYAVISNCNNPNKCDKNDFKYYLKFQLQKPTSQGNVYLKASSSIDNYNGVVNAEKVHFTIYTNQKGIGGNIEKNGTGTLSDSSVDSSEVDNTQGTKINPYIVTNNMTITLPDKNAEIWKDKNLKCVYFKVDFSSQDSQATAARYYIKPYEFALHNIYKENDTIHVAADNIPNDHADEGVFQLSNKNLYSICATTKSDYGKKITFEFKDTEKLTVSNHIAGENAANQNGEENVNVNDSVFNGDYDDLIDIDMGKNPENAEQFDDVCALIEGETLRQIQELVGYAQIGTVFLILVLGMLDFTGAIGSGEDNAFKKAGSKFLKRLIAGALVFLIPAILGIILNLVSIANGCEVSIFS